MAFCSDSFKHADLKDIETVDSVNFVDFLPHSMRKSIEKNRQSSPFTKSKYTSQSIPIKSVI